MSLLIGIDPGLHGAFAVIDYTGRLVDASPFPTHTVNKKLRIDGVTLAYLLRCTKAKHAFVENVSSRPRQAGQFQFGINCGMVHGILYAHSIPMTLVAPASWKGEFGIKRAEDETKTQKKGEARELAKTLYPAQANLFERVKDDGVAEATLIALYGLYLTLNKEGNYETT